MRSTDSPRIDIARALGDMAARAAPGEPGLVGTCRRASARLSGRHLALRRALVALPLAAAACLCAGLLALGGLPRPDADEFGYRALNARAAAARVLGRDSPTEGGRIETVLLGYIEDLWTAGGEI
jgi:hypothetical protein